MKISPVHVIDLAAENILRAKKAAEAKQRVASSGAMLVDTEAMAQMLSVSVAWLRLDRRTNRRIPFCRLGGKVLYSPSRVQAALEQLAEGGPQTQRKS